MEIAWAAARAARPPRMAWRRYAIAASLVLVAGASTLMWRQRGASRDETLRGAESPVTLVAPLGEIAGDQKARFTWRRVGQAEVYTIVVVDTAGTELFAAETRDTALALPDSVHLAPGQSYLWWVQARRTDQSTVTAVTQRVFVRPR